MKPFQLIVALFAIICLSASAWAEPANVLSGFYIGHDHYTAPGSEQRNWIGVTNVVKTKTLLTNRIWLYTGIQYADELSRGEVSSWGGDVRMVWRGRWTGTYFWMKTGWLNHIAEKGYDKEAGMTIGLGGLIDVGSGFNLATEYIARDTGPGFESAIYFGVIPDGLFQWVKDLL